MCAKKNSTCFWLYSVFVGGYLHILRKLWLKYKQTEQKIPDLRKRSDKDHLDNHANCVDNNAN